MYVSTLTWNGVEGGDGKGGRGQEEVGGDGKRWEGPGRSERGWDEVGGDEKK